MALLQVNNVSLAFGGTQALDNVNFAIERGELLALIGPNGAGKTSLLNCISGFYRPQQGEIIFNNHNIVSTPTHHVAKLGIARTFQHTALYPGLSTLDNLLAARHIHMRYGLLDSIIRVGRARREEQQHRQAVEEIIAFLDLGAIRYTPVAVLPNGLRKRIELGRALALEPQLLLLDEPMTGMNQSEKDAMVRLILAIHEQRGVTCMLIEHDMGVVMDIAQRIVVLDFGINIASGTPAVIKNDPVVIKAYLGEDHQLAA